MLPAGLLMHSRPERRRKSWRRQAAIAPVEAVDPWSSCAESEMARDSMPQSCPHCYTQLNHRQQGMSVRSDERLPAAAGWQLGGC